MEDVEFLNPPYPSLMNSGFMENYPEKRFPRSRRYWMKIEIREDR